MISDHSPQIFYEANTFFQKPQTNLRQLDEIVAKIHSFEKLPDGWHFGRGSKILGAAAVGAQKIAGVGIQNGYEVEIFPGSEQDILIALNKGGDYYEVIANEDATISYFCEKDGARVLSRERQPLEEIENKLNEDNVFIWYTIASSIQITGTLKKSASSALLSETRQVEESQLSTANAL